jgi:hypothetical protein
MAFVSIDWGIAGLLLRELHTCAVLCSLCAQKFVCNNILRSKYVSDFPCGTVAWRPRKTAMSQRREE